jgi:hypothetical protein
MRLGSVCHGAVLTLLLAAASPAGAQAGQPPAGRPEDGASIDAIVKALYDVISGPAGQARDWARFHALFAPGARMIPTGARPDGGRGSVVVDPAGYVERSRAVLEGRGFFEREIARRTERFGSIAHVWSTYEARHRADDPQPFMRGVNSIQLFFDGTRWWVLTVAWSPETPAEPIPACYLGGENPAPCPDAGGS